MANQLRELSTEESLELLQYHSRVGHIAFNLEGKTLVFPVNYLADETSIVFCTASGTKLSALKDGLEVAFEVDDSRPLMHEGWSVLVNGMAKEVTDEQELEMLHRGPLKSWAVPPAEHWIRINIESISGRRIEAS